MTARAVTPEDINVVHRLRQFFSGIGHFCEASRIASHTTFLTESCVGNALRFSVACWITLLIDSMQLIGNWKKTGVADSDAFPDTSENKSARVLPAGTEDLMEAPTLCCSLLKERMKGPVEKRHTPSENQYCHTMYLM